MATPRRLALAVTAVLVGAVALTLSTTRPTHIVIVVMENREYGAVIGSSNWPYVNSLAKANALATSSYGIGHPSQPNYLTMLFGDKMGIADNGESYKLTGPSLVDQIEASGRTWAAYVETMPTDTIAPCLFPSSGLYRKKHNPFASSTLIQTSSARCARVRNLSKLATDPLPNFSFVIPNMESDGHDSSGLTPDNWLKGHLPAMLARLSGSDFLVLTWDEGTTTTNHIVTIFAGPGAKKVYRSAAYRWNHYSLMKTIEFRWGLPCMRHSCDLTVRIMTDLLS